MKTTGILPTIFFAAAISLSLSGCGDNKSTTTAESNEPPKVIEITANDTMKFNVTDFSVQRGQKVSVTLKDIGTMPKLSMGHNFILLKQGTDAKAFSEAGLPYAGQDYIAPELKDKVLAHTKTIGPGESDTITFTAPSIPGFYDFVCAFPGHFASGMHGRMTVM
jgi:azurin